MYRLKSTKEIFNLTHKDYPSEYSDIMYPYVLGVVSAQLEISLNCIEKALSDLDKISIDSYILDSIKENLKFRLDSVAEYCE